MLLLSFRPPASFAIVVVGRVNHVGGIMELVNLYLMLKIADLKRHISSTTASFGLVKMGGKNRPCND